MTISRDVASPSTRYSSAPEAHSWTRERHAPRDFLGDKYRITALLGEGGMGTVWRARCIALDVDVAIKVLHGEHADSRGRARLLREARATARLSHASIVRTIDFGETADGEPFLVMELLDGLSLADWHDGRGRMPATEAVRVVLPIASALVAAHAHGIVHRDVKPENVIMVPSGAQTFLPKIVDFGIAKVASERSAGVLTEAGAVLGSIEYMSPEQANGKNVSERTDIWGLSVVLYELLTGRRPFIGPDLTTMILALHVCRPTPIMAFAVGDPELWEIVARGLKKQPEERWPSMHALGCALAAWAEERGVTEDVAGTTLVHDWLAPPAEPLSRPVSTPAYTAVATTADTFPSRTSPSDTLPARYAPAPDEPPSDNTAPVAELTFAPPPPALLARAAAALLVAPLVASLVLALRFGFQGAVASPREGRAAAGPAWGAVEAQPTAPPLSTRVALTLARCASAPSPCATVSQLARVPPQRVAPARPGGELFGSSASAARLAPVRSTASR
jgi:serine/threonine-protein kinase